MRRGWVDRDRLALLFWPDADERAAKRNLRQLLLRVRRLELAEGLEAAPSAVRWSVDCDVVVFRRALAAGERERAVRLYAGALLEGFVVHDVGGFDAWLELERQRLHEVYHEAVTWPRTPPRRRAGSATRSTCCDACWRRSRWRRTCSRPT